MTRMKAQVHIEHYLKSYNIRYTKDVDNGIPRITIVYVNCDRCPDKILESCIWFYKDAMEARVYYDQTAADWCRKSNHIPELIRLLNYINACVWPRIIDGMGNALYMLSCLYTSRIYLTEDDGYDITLTTMIPYDFFEIAPLKSEDFITACCPSLLDELSPAIFGVLLSRLDTEQAIRYVKENVLSDSE